MQLTQSRLKTKLRVSTGALIAAMLVSSLIAYMKMRQVSQLSTSVVERCVPTVDAVRSLQTEIGRTTSALKSYLLFGIDPAMAGKRASSLGPASSCSAPSAMTASGMAR